ncbi:MAG: hypothetical protein WDN69_07685 [Aliidongia sp.]
MRIGTLAFGLAILVAFAAADAAAADKMRFWNTTTHTFVQLYMAKAGTDQWGPNQCENDKDKAVDADERLALTGIEPGRYDVKLVEKSGKSCVLRDIEVKSGGAYAFSIGEEDLKQCR